ncbi:unnamed protein product [Euphydryas editha]|uniref:HTH psq-type domain-containing protein n=1 Tax=Euphydryas editha TaxID=104508 RepID=A0AAU9UDX5_EUPED|nr:unnamed protein product [Euphydryas editha]
MSKRKYNSWNNDIMEAAIKKFKDGELRFNEVCRVYYVPKPTFRRHLKGLNKHQRIGRPKDLTAEMETELVRHVLLLESRFFWSYHNRLETFSLSVSRKIWIET